jgi:hypothetical protein
MVILVILLVLVALAAVSLLSDGYMRRRIRNYFRMRREMRRRLGPPRM